MHSPRLMMLAQAVGEYLRYHSAIGTTLSELVILIVARAWSQDFEWSVHAPAAERAGIAPAVIAAIRDGRRPEGMSEDEARVYDFSTELQVTKRVSDATWARAEGRFGKTRGGRSGGAVGLLHAAGDAAQRGAVSAGAGVGGAAAVSGVGRARRGMPGVKPGHDGIRTLNVVIAGLDPAILSGRGLWYSGLGIMSMPWATRLV